MDCYYYYLGLVIQVKAGAGHNVWMGNIYIYILPSERCAYIAFSISAVTIMGHGTLRRVRFVLHCTKPMMLLYFILL